MQYTANVLSFDDSAVHLFSSNVRHLAAPMAKQKSLRLFRPDGCVFVTTIYYYCPIA